MKYKVLPSNFATEWVSALNQVPEEVDFSGLEQKVEQDIQNTKVFSKEEFQNRIKKMSVWENMPIEKAYAIWVELAKKNNWVIKDFDLDKAYENISKNKDKYLWTNNTSINSWNTQVEEDNQPNTWIGKFMQWAWDLLKKWAWEVWAWLKNFAWWLSEEAPKAVANTTWFILWDLPWNTIWKAGDFIAEKMWYDTTNNSLEKRFEEAWDKIKWLWQQQSEQITNAYNIDEDSIMTSLWEFWTEWALLFTPTWVSNLVSKYPQAADKIKKLSWSLEKLKSLNPKMYDKIAWYVEKWVWSLWKLKWVWKDAWIWAAEATKYDIMDKWEVSPTWTALWAVANPVWQWIISWWEKLASKVRWDFVSNIYKAIKPSTKHSNKDIKKGISTIWQSLKDFNKKPKDLETFATDLKDNLKKIYQNHINPNIEKAMNKKWLVIPWKDPSKIDINDILEKSIKDLSEKHSLRWNLTEDILTWKNNTKRIKEIYDRFKKDFQDLDLLEAEALKRQTSAINVANQDWLSTAEVDFVKNMNKHLQDSIEEKLKNLTWEWIKKYKEQYWAIARYLDDINRAVIRNNKMSWDTLFSWLWKISWANQIMNWDVIWGSTQVLVWEILKLIKDPDELIRRWVKELYKTPSKIPWKVTEKATWIIGWKQWYNIDKEAWYYDK